MRVSLWDSLEPLYSDSTVPARPVKAAAVDVARGGTAAVHILLNDLHEGDALDASVRQNGRPVRAAQWYRLVHVQVKKNTGPVGFTEEPEKPNPHVVRRAPFRVYDAMEPIVPPLRVSETTTALRLEIPMPLNTRPGRRDYEIRLACGDEEAVLKFTVEIHKVRIPAAGADSLPYTNWFSLSQIANRHGLKMWSEAHWKMIRRYADLMYRARQNMFWFMWSDVFTRTASGLKLNAPRLRRIVKTFTDAGLHFIEGGHVAARTGGEWKSPTFDIILKGPLATTPEGNADLAKALGQIREEIDRNGWGDRWIQHVTDEPLKENAADYRMLTGMVRKYLPGVPILDATMDTSLAGSVDIWCPQCQEYQKHRSMFEPLQKLGDCVWFYTCCLPGGPWLNRLLDEELLRPALLGWATARFNLQGFLHWGLNHYMSDQNPFEENEPAMGSHFLPPGDTHVVYPGKGRPWSSLRLEAQREGFEDYELLKLLKERQPKTAASVIRSALRGFDDYTKDTKVFRKARRKLLVALSQEK